MTLLLVDDDDDFREAAANWFSRRGHHVAVAASADEAVMLAAQTEFEVGVFALRMPRKSGLDLLRDFRSLGSEAEILILTGEAGAEAAAEALRLGAYDYMLKPCRLDELERCCRKAREAGALRRENRNLRTLVGRTGPAGEMVGRSPAMREVFRLIERVGPSDKPVLIEGESGTGKELVARALQRIGSRADRPFVTINCAALPEQLLESELFGHERGAFTGAAAAKPGLFEAADGGTLFVDEIGELALPLQAKLLRALEDGSFRRVGSLKERRADVRIIAATNRELIAEIAAGRFREDLYYRIAVLTLRLPPLRERDGDVALLAQAILGSGWLLEPEARSAVERYHWPGNVRQLKNALERAKVLADGGVIRVRDLPAAVVAAAKTARPADPAPDARGGAPRPLGGIDWDGFIEQRLRSGGGNLYTEWFSRAERHLVTKTLRHTHGNQLRAADILGITRRSLRNKIRTLGITIERSVSSGPPEAAPPADDGGRPNSPFHFTA